MKNEKGIIALAVILSMLLVISALAVFGVVSGRFGLSYHLNNRIQALRDAETASFVTYQLMRDDVWRTPAEERAVLTTPVAAAAAAQVAQDAQDAFDDAEAAAAADPGNTALQEAADAANDVLTEALATQAATDADVTVAINAAGTPGSNVPGSTLKSHALTINGKTIDVFVESVGTNTVKAKVAY